MLFFWLIFFVNFNLKPLNREYPFCYKINILQWGNIKHPTKWDILPVYCILITTVFSYFNICPFKVTGTEKQRPDWLPCMPACHLLPWSHPWPYSKKSLLVWKICALNWWPCLYRTASYYHRNLMVLNSDWRTILWRGLTAFINRTCADYIRKCFSEKHRSGFKIIQIVL